MRTVLYLASVPTVPRPSLTLYVLQYVHACAAEERRATQHNRHPSASHAHSPRHPVPPCCLVCACVYNPCHPACMCVKEYMQPVPPCVYVCQGVHTTRATLRVCVSRSTCNPCHTGVRLGAHASTVLIHMQENIIMNQPRPTTGVGRTAGRVEASGSSSLPEPLMTVQFVNSGLSPSSSYSTQDCPPRPPTIL